MMILLLAEKSHSIIYHKILWLYILDLYTDADKCIYSMDPTWNCRCSNLMQFPSVFSDEKMSQNVCIINC